MIGLRQRILRSAVAALLVAGAAVTAIYAPSAWDDAAPSRLGTIVAPSAWAQDEGGASGAGPDGRPPAAAAPEAETTVTLFADDPMRPLAIALRARQRELDERQAMLEAEARRLETLRAELEAALARMQEVNRRMETAAGRIDTQQQAELRRWVKIYEAMAPDQAGQVLQDLDPELARNILSAMDARKAGRILNTIDPQRAVRLSADVGSASR